jgi:hypothetical protein
LRLVAQVVADVAAPSGGTWTQPDVAAAVRRHKFAPSARVDILSFEVKTHRGASLVSVYEALAHARFVNFSYLVWKSTGMHMRRPREVRRNCSRV